MPETHALLNASGSHRWGTCAPSLALEAPIADVSSKYADEGTAAHTLGAWCLETGQPAAEYPHAHIQVDDTLWPVTDEMKSAVQAYVNRVKAYAEGGGTILVEQKVDYGHWLDLSPKDHAGVTAFGTSDAVILHEERITIVDLKYGMGVKVDAKDNEQLKLYALGALYEYEMLGDFREVTMAICQPRIGHFDEDTIDVTSLKTFALKMKAAAHNALKFYLKHAEPEPHHYAPSEAACRWCKASATCPALAAEVEHETRDLFASVLLPAEIPEDRLAQAMAKVPMIEDLCKAIRAETERRLLAGQSVQGFKLVEGRRGPRKWASEADAEAMLKSFRLKHDEMYDYSVISPTTAEKRLKEASPKRWAKLQPLITQSDGKPSVAPEDDKRPALKVESAVEGFAALAAPEGVEELV